MIRACLGLITTQDWTYEFHKRRKISWLDQARSSQEELCSKQLIRLQLVFRHSADHSSRGVLPCVLYVWLRNPEKGGQRSILDYKRLWMNESPADQYISTGHSGAQFTTMQNWLWVSVHDRFPNCEARPGWALLGCVRDVFIFWMKYGR
jgi:hypothetical protein